MGNTESINPENLRHFQTNSSFYILNEQASLETNKPYVEFSKKTFKISLPYITERMINLLAIKYERP